MRRKLPLLFGATFLAFAVAACEGPEGPAGPAGPQGPQGPAGEAGAPGENALNTCSDCHSSDATIVAIEQQFESSPHGPANFGRIESRVACAMCHSSQGFVAAATGEEPNFDGGVASINCRTCHQIHMDYVADDFALTTTDPVTLLLTGNTVD
ncbi:MAG: cytochrome c3 family protein, partial [Gemmatimonadota bacterium]